MPALPTVMPYVLMALGLSTGALGVFWSSREHRIIRGSVWFLVGAILFTAGFVNVTHAQPNETLQVEQTPPTDRGVHSVGRQFSAN